jgi:hypothetical protein
MTPCIECGKMTTGTHHVIPRSRGGTATVPLCPNCHALAHGIGIGQLSHEVRRSSPTGYPQKYLKKASPGETGLSTGDVAAMASIYWAALEARR